MAGRELLMRNQLQVEPGTPAEIWAGILAYSKQAAKRLRGFLLLTWLVLLLLSSGDKMTWKIVLHCEIMPQGTMNNSMTTVLANLDVRLEFVN